MDGWVGGKGREGGKGRFKEREGGGKGKGEEGGRISPIVRRKLEPAHVVPGCDVDVVVVGGSQREAGHVDDSRQVVERRCHARLGQVFVLILLTLLLLLLVLLPLPFILLQRVCLSKQACPEVFHCLVNHVYLGEGGGGGRGWGMGGWGGNWKYYRGNKQMFPD